jgi:hypothetical protein
MSGGPECSAIERIRAFTQVLAAVAERSSATGVYWGETGATHAAQFFVEVAAGKESTWPVLWTGISRASDGPGRVSYLTLGFRQFQIPELMLTAPDESATEALWFMLDLFGSCAARGTPIPDGDTVGQDEAQRLRVRYIPSPIDGDAQVWRVDLP